MTSFITVKETLRVSNLQKYEEKFTSQAFDDDAVLNCISDPELKDELKFIIPVLGDYVNFRSHFKKLHRERSVIPDTGRCDKKYVLTADMEDVQALGSQHQQVTMTRVDMNGSAIPVPPPPDIIPSPPPMPTSEDSYGFINSLPIAAPPFLAELLQKKLTHIPSETSNSAHEQDDGYPPSISSEDLEADQKLIEVPRNGVNSALVNEINNRNATRTTNGEEIAFKTEQKRLSRSNSVTPTTNPELNKILESRKSVDVEACIRNKKKQTHNSVSNNTPDFECPKRMVQLRPTSVKSSETSIREDEIRLQSSCQKTKNEDPIVNSSTDESRKPGPPVPAKPKKSTISPPTPVESTPDISDKPNDIGNFEVETSDQIGNPCSNTVELPYIATTDIAQGTEPLQSTISPLPEEVIQNSSPELNTTDSSRVTQTAAAAALSGSPVQIQYDILKSVQILTEIGTTPKQLSCPLPPPPPPMPIQLSTPTCVDIRGKLMSDIRGGIELKKVGKNSKTLRSRQLNISTSLPVNPLQSILEDVMKNRRFDIQGSDDSDSDDSDSDDDDDQLMEDWEE